MLDLSQVGDLVTEARKRLGLTQSALSRRAGLSRATIEALENGRLKEIGFAKLTRICVVLGLHFTLTARTANRPTLDDLLAQPADD